MGRDTLDEQPWCNTCGKFMSKQEYEDNNGDCNVCREWWEENNPDVADK